MQLRGHNLHCCSLTKLTVRLCGSACDLPTFASLHPDSPHVTVARPQNQLRQKDAQYEAQLRSLQQQYEKVRAQVRTGWY